jgi:hypothetical protein
MARRLGKGVGADGLGQIQQKGLDICTDLSSYREMNSENATISTTYTGVELKFAALGCGGKI